MQITNCDTDPIDYDSEPENEVADLGENLLNKDSNDEINHECFQTLVSLLLFFRELARCLHQVSINLAEFHLWPQSYVIAPVFLRHFVGITDCLSTLAKYFYLSLIAISIGTWNTISQRH